MDYRAVWIVKNGHVNVTDGGRRRVEVGSQPTQVAVAEE